MFIIPVSPVAKGRARVTRTGHAFTPKKTREYTSKVQAFAQEWMDSNKKEKMDGPLLVDMTFMMPRAKSNKDQWHTIRPDVDNLAKAVLDALNGIAWHDDAQIVCLRAQKKYAQHLPPCVSVTIEREP